MAQQPLRKANADDAEVGKSAAKLKSTATKTANEGTEVAELAYEELREQLHVLKKDFADLSESIVKAGQQTAKDAAVTARNSGRKVATKASEGAEYAADQFETVLEDAEDFARQRPGVALGIAAGAGFLLALAMSRR